MNYYKIPILFLFIMFFSTLALANEKMEMENTSGVSNTETYCESCDNADALITDEEIPRDDEETVREVEDLLDDLERFYFDENVNIVITKSSGECTDDTEDTGEDDIDQVPDDSMTVNNETNNGLKVSEKDSLQISIIKNDNENSLQNNSVNAQLSASTRRVRALTGARSTKCKNGKTIVAAASGRVRNCKDSFFNMTCKISEAIEKTMICEKARQKIRKRFFKQCRPYKFFPCQYRDF